MALNYPVVAAAAFASFLFGALWYSPAMFAGRWMALTGRGPDAAATVSPAAILGGAFLLAFASALAFAALLGPHRGLWPGAIAGLAAGSCLVAASYGITYLFEQRPFGLWLINGGFHTVQFAILGAIVGAFG
jgi:hypothetical protein